MVIEVYRTFGPLKSNEIFEVLNSRIVSKSGVKESTWNVYTSMYGVI